MDACASPTELSLRLFRWQATCGEALYPGYILELLRAAQK